MKVKRKRRMSRRRRELTYIAVMVLLAITVSIGLTRSVMRDDKEFEEYEQQSQEFNARMQRIDEKREASGQNAMLEQVRTWQQDTEPDKYAVFDTMSADWGGEEDGFVLYEIPEEYSRTGGYFPEKMQVYTYCVCKQYGVRYDLVVALIEKESGYKFDKVGDDGHSIGYMQIYEECHRDRIPTKAIDYVEINEKAVQSYNSMFREELEYKTQTVVGWNLKPDILIHGSPCQDMSIAGHQGKATGDGRINRGKGSDEGSGTRSSLMWETIHIIENMGEWRPRYVIWENVKNVKSKYMRPNFDRYMDEMEKLGYTNNYAVLDAREFGLPQARERVFTVSVLNGEKFEFDDLIRTPMRNLQEFLEDDVPDIYDVTQPSVLACIGEKGIRRATVIKDCAYTITTRQDRTPAQVIDRGDGRYRYLTERECWRLMGYSDEDFDRAKAVQERNGKYYKALYDQAGNSIAVPIFESIFRKIILQEVA